MLRVLFRAVGFFAFSSVLSATLHFVFLCSGSSGSRLFVSSGIFVFSSSISMLVSEYRSRDKSTETEDHSKFFHNSSLEVSWVHSLVLSSQTDPE